MREIPFWHLHVYKVSIMTEVDWLGRGKEEALEGAIQAVKQGRAVHESGPADCEYIALAFKCQGKMRDSDIKEVKLKILMSKGKLKRKARAVAL